ncbi:MAG: hypothetical protein ACRDQU_10520 [Pseudonocardiaceae bacterium]
MASWRRRTTAAGLTALGLLVAACGAGSSAPATSGRPANSGQVAERALSEVPSQPPGVATWAAALHDARHSGSSTGAGTRRWDAPRIITYSSPSVTASGLAYVGDHSGRVHVYDVRDGREVATYRPNTTGQIWTSVVVDRSTGPTSVPRTATSTASSLAGTCSSTSISAPRWTPTRRWAPTVAW